MITLIPIEPLNEAHGMLIVAAFNELFINWGGQSDGDGCGYGGNGGFGNGDGFGNGNGFGDGDGCGYGKPPEAWIVGS